MTEYRTIQVASDIQKHGDRDRWSLARAVLADAPASLKPSQANRVIDDLCAQMTLQGVLKQDGSPYMPAYLKGQRAVAMAWAPDEVQDEASFEAHAENREGDARATFLALCAATRGEDVEPPASVKPLAWKAAVAKTKTTRKKRYKVQAQAVRTAKGGKAKNTPTVLSNATYQELIKHLSAGVVGLRSFNLRVANFDLSDDERDNFRLILAALRVEVDRTDAALEKLTDEALADLLKA